MKDRTIKNGKIYVLKDPIDGSIRYVGKYQRKYLSNRLKAHVREAIKSNSYNHRLNWIRLLIQQNLQPQIELIQDGFTNSDELCQAEMFLINFYKQIGLNLVNGTPGGDGNNLPRSEKTRQLMSIAAKGKKKSLEHRLNIATAKIGEKNPQFGKQYSSEEKLKLSMLNGGQGLIKCIETEQIFFSQKEAGRQLQIHDGSISAVLKGKRKHAQGYTFKYI